MAITQDEIESFNRFIVEVMNNGPEELTLEECLCRWRASQIEAEDLASIQRGIDDADAGRIRPFDEVDRDIRKKHNLPLAE